MPKIKLLILCWLACAAGVRAQAPAPASGAPAVKSMVPAYLAAEKDLSRFHLYADGGFSADWYVGYNNCWVVKLPPAASGAYAKAFIGAKLGRAKIMSWPASWDKRPIPGKIYMALNNEPTFNSDHMYFLSEASDLPREPLPDDYLDGVDSARWLWTEVPLSKISAEKPNYLALWSSSRFFTSSSSSPIVAAAKTNDSEENVWLSRSIKGAPPTGNSVFDIPIAGLKPAMALKLVPQNEYKVLIKGFAAEVGPDGITASFAAIGEDVRAAWLEISYDKFDWQRVTRYMYRAPYFWTFGRTELTREMFYLRAAAVDNLENVGFSKEITVPAASKEIVEAPEENP